MARYHRNISNRIRRVQQIAREHYEPGNYARSYYKVWQDFVYPVYPMCYATFLKYINVKPSELAEPNAPRQVRHGREVSGKIRKVQEITRQHYVAGDKKRCYRAIWQEHVLPEYRISYRTYMDYLAAKPSELS